MLHSIIYFKDGAQIVSNNCKVIPRIGEKIIREGKTYTVMDVVYEYRQQEVVAYITCV